MRAKAFLMVGAVILGSAPTAMADEQIDPLVQSGDWGAFEHRASMTAAPDVCIATNMLGNTEKGIVLRAGAGIVELRVVDESWSLPPNATGVVSVTVGDWKHSLDATEMQSTMITSIVPLGVLLPMFAAMDKAGRMTVKVGTANPFIVSLAGSTKATDAFRTCAGIDSNSGAPGSNPFAQPQ